MWLNTMWLHTYLWLKLVTYGLSVISKIEFNNFCSSNNVYMLFYKRSVCQKHLRGIGLVPMDATCWVSWGEGIKLHIQHVPPEDLFRCLHSSIFVTFFNRWPLSPAASRVSWCWSCFVCSGLTYKIWSEGGAYMYIYCVVCHHVIAAPYVRRVGVSLHTVTLLMTIQNVQWTMSSLYSLKLFLLLEVF